MEREARKITVHIPADQLETAPGFWERAGETRRKLLSKGFKARVENVLIAQLCLDQNILLVTRAPDFRHFVNLCGLRLA